MSDNRLQVPGTVLRYLRRFERRRGWQRVVRRAGLSVLLTIVWGLAWCTVDRMIALPAGLRAVVLGINFWAVALIVGRGVVRLTARVDWLAVARDVERREQRWGERLETLVSRALGPQRLVGSRDLLDALGVEVAADAERFEPTELLPWGRVWRPWAASAVVAGFGSMLAVLLPAMDLPRLARRYAMPLAQVAPAATTRLLVTPGDIKIPAGEALRVRASAERLDEGSLTLHVRAVAGSEWTEQTMSSAPDGTFEARVANLERDAEYFVTGGDARSDVFRATVLRRPAVIAFHWTIAYPPYLKLPPRSVTNDDAIVDAPVGSTVMLDLDASEPLTTAAIEVGGQAHPTIPGAQPNQRRASFAMRGSQPLIVRMMSEAGVPGEFTGGRVRATADLAPIVTLNPLESDGTLLKLRYQATDDFGLSRLDAEVETEDGRQHVVPVALAGDEREQRGVLEIDAAAVNASKGDELIVRLRGEDRGGQFALSKPVHAMVGSARVVEKPPAAAPATLPATEPSQGVDVSGFSESLQAYFQAIPRDHK